MLTERQLNIVNELLDSEEEFVTLFSLSKKIGVSSKTIRNETNAINDFLENYGAFIESVPSKGLRLVADNQEKLKDSLQSFHYDVTHNIYDQNGRISHLLSRLVNSRKGVNVCHLLEEMAVSESRFYDDVNKAKKIVEKYGLNIKKENGRISIEGNENDIRAMILAQNLRFDTLFLNREEDLIGILGEHLSEALISEQFRIDDYVFQNLLLHLETALRRIELSHSLDDDGQSSIVKSHEIEVARKLQKLIENRFGIKLPEKEVEVFAIHLQGKRAYDKVEMITKETDNIVSQILMRIQDITGINLLSDIDLRIRLALHLIPLRTRMDNNLFLKNIIAEEVKQEFSYAYELATIASDYLLDKYGKKLPNDEITFIAIHFEEALSKKRGEKENNILVIVDSRKSITIPIRIKITNWFKEEISSINFINTLELYETDFKKYDYVFSTCPINKKLPVEVVRLNYFLDERDRAVIDETIHDMKKENIMNCFSKEMFAYRNFTNKNEIIKSLCDMINAKECVEGLYDAVLRREERGFTSFGNLIALPHPELPISKHSHVAVMVLDKEIAWKDSQNVQIVILVCAKNDKVNNDFRTILEVLSTLLKSKKKVEQILKNPTYETFINTITKGDN